MEMALPECYGNYYKKNQAKCRACFAAQECKQEEKVEKPKRGRKPKAEKPEVEIDE